MEFGRMYTVTCIWRLIHEELPQIIPYIFLETTVIGLHFAADNIGLSSLKIEIFLVGF